MTAKVAVMKGQADETKPGIFSDPLVHDTIVDTWDNEDFRFKFWKFGYDETQVEDVQGRLRHNIAFWKEILHVPSPILSALRRVTACP